MPALTTLNLAGNVVSSLEGLDRFLALRELTLLHNPIACQRGYRQRCATVPPRGPLLHPLSGRQASLLAP